MATALSNLQNARGAHLSSRARPLILISDDDADMRDLFRTMLGMNGYSVIEATDGLEAVHLAETEGPDLILMDGSLPLLDGFSAARRIRDQGQANYIPIIFVSGHDESFFFARAREAGGDEYLVKPFPLNELRLVLEKYLGRAERSLSAL